MGCEGQRKAKDTYFHLFVANIACGSVNNPHESIPEGLITV